MIQSASAPNVALHTLLSSGHVVEEWIDSLSKIAISHIGVSSSKFTKLHSDLFFL